MASGFHSIGFIGAGRTGTALAVGLTNAGYHITAVASRTPESARTLAARIPGCEAVVAPSELPDRCDLVFLTVPDGEIGATASALRWHKGQEAVHCSGALSADVLSSAREQGALTGAFHPLQTFATLDDGADRLAGSTFAVEGEGDLAEWLEAAVADLGGHPIRLRTEDRPLYHAAAVMVCGYVTTLLDTAAGLWETMGLSREAAMQALLPLVSGTIGNLEKHGAKAGVTGPIVRGDTGTVRQHLEALEDRAPEALGVYREMGLSMVSLAVDRGSIGQDQATELKRMLRTRADKPARRAIHVPTRGKQRGAY